MGLIPVKVQILVVIIHGEAIARLSSSKAIAFLIGKKIEQI